jgi:hypothetical protein
MNATTEATMTDTTKKRMSHLMEKLAWILSKPEALLDDLTEDQADELAQDLDQLRRTLDNLTTEG